MSPPPLHFIFLGLGFIMFVVLMIIDRRRNNPTTWARTTTLLMSSFLSATAIVVAGFNAIYYAFVNEVYPGQSFDIVRGALAIGGLTIIIWSLYGLSWALERE